MIPVSVNTQVPGRMYPPRGASLEEVKRFVAEVIEERLQSYIGLPLTPANLNAVEADLAGTLSSFVAAGVTRNQPKVHVSCIGGQITITLSEDLVIP